NLLLEEFSLQLTLPYSNIGSAEPPQQVNYAFRSHGWFEQHQQQKDQHKYVPIHTEGWCYLAPILRFDGKEYAKLRASRGSPFSEERYRNELQGRINNYGYPPLQPAKLITLQSSDWVFYQEKYDRHPTGIDFYCLPLSSKFYLTIG